MTEQELKDIIDGFAINSIIFPSEAQFQYKLALELEKQLYDVYLEVIANNGKKFNAKPKYYIDIIAKKGDEVYGIELKYKTKNSDIYYKDSNGKVIGVTFEQGATNKGSIGYWKDVSRLEEYKSGNIKVVFNKELSGIKPTKCFAILLTNSPKYWNGVSNSLSMKFFPVNNKSFSGALCHKILVDSSGKMIDGRSKVDPAFKVVDITSSLMAGKYKPSFPESIKPITIIGSYKCLWNDYGLIGITPYNCKNNKKINNLEFKYLILEI